LYFSIAKSSESTDEVMYSILTKKFNLLSQAMNIFIQASIEKYQTAIQNVTDREDLTTELEYINNYLDRLLHQRLQNRSVTNEEKMKKIVYRLEDTGDLQEGYLHKGIVYDVVLQPIAEIKNITIKVENGKLVHIVSNS
jgi:Na+/phosphate symporter